MNWKLLPPALLLAGCLFFVQYHGWSYWNARFDPRVGWLAEVVLEGLALAFWFLAARPARSWAHVPGRVALVAAGMAATTALLAGPVYQVALAELERARAAEEAGRAEIARIATREAELRQAVAHYRTLSLARLGWRDSLAQAEADMAAASAELTRLRAAAAVTASLGGWRTLPHAVLMAVALVLAQFGAVVMISLISRMTARPAFASPASPPLIPGDAEGGAGASPEPGAGTSTALGTGVPTSRSRANGERHSHRSQEDANSQAESANSQAAVPTGNGREQEWEQPLTVDDLTVHRIQREIRERVKASGLSTAKWAEQHAIHKPTLSYLLNHQRRAAAGERTISASALETLARRFLTSPEEGMG